ncbi:lysylphosphatidylglycerol synthase transmembrane domain-containing protein [Actibacterium ureilyticum]|uniref:lysylphosphatidylglycerol synthase transmembrane domain-containing protein n=1 Tax=Actibacterium ureilyticum TaxID=1590614 RepID=UPI000BAB2413|nr:lysylphosphatidylglycerol synthase transmembrane domain-containing protein [Actibacterium ureilyticum]
MVEPTPPAAPDNRRKNMILFALKLLVSAGLIAYLLFTQIESMDEIWAAMGGANPWLLLLAFSLNTIGYLLCSWRWQILLRAQGFIVPLIELIRAYTIGIFFNSFLPGLMSGDFIRAMDISDRVPSYARSFLILFVERLTGMFGLWLLAVLALPMIGWEIVAQTKIGWLLLVVGCILAGIWTLFFHRRLADWTDPIFRLPLIGKLRGIVVKITETAKAFSERKGAVMACMAISVIFQANVVLHYYLIGLALGIDVSPIAYFAIIPVSLFVMMIPASINGIGVREQIFIFLFGTFGVSAAAAISLAWIAFGMVLLQAVVGGILFGLRKKRAPAPVGG